LAKLYQERNSVTLANNTAKNLDLTVPEGKIWKLLGVRLHNGDDVQRVLRCYILDGSGNVLHSLGSATAAAGAQYEFLGYHPTGVSSSAPLMENLVKGGNKLRLVWESGGASSGGTAYYMLTYQEMVE